MADYAHNYTDKQLEVLEKRFQSVYRQAEKEVTQKLEDYLKKFEAKDKAKQELLAEGKISEEDYKNWRYGQMMTGKRWKEMRDRLAQDYTNANQNAVDAMNHRLPDVFAENTNYSTYDIENSLHVDTSFTMYDRQTVDRLLRDNHELLPQPSVDIPKDLRWNRQHIQSAVEQGILQGESIPKIAKRLQDVTNMNKAAATRNARTAMTGAQNGGRIESYKRARDLGIDMRQCWLATMDGRVRHSHAVMDGETQEVGKEFSNGCMYPGDPNGPPAETWNCRCTLIAQLKGFEHDVSQGRFSKLDNMSYDEWKEYHRSKIKTKNKVQEQVEKLNFETVKQAEDFARQKGVKFAIFDGFDKETANIIANALNTLPEGVTPKSVSNLINFKKGFGGKLQRKDSQIYGVTLDNLWGINFGDGMKDYEGGVMVGYNTRNYKNAAAIQASKDKTNSDYKAKTGHMWHFNTSGEATYYHEIGHVYADIKGIPNGFSEAREKWLNESKCDILKTDGEAWAEAWAGYFTGNKNLPDYIAKFIKGVL